MDKMKTVAIIVAGGRGKRMGRPKQFLPIAGRPMLAWTIAAFQTARSIDGIILVVSREQMAAARKLKFSKIINVIEGGRERQDSVFNGLMSLPEAVGIVIIHDGARPAVTEKIIERAVREAKKYGAVVVGVPVKDTIKKVVSSKLKVESSKLNAVPAGRQAERWIEATIDRSELWAAQTPQVFKRDVIVEAYRKYYRKVRATDDAMLVEKTGKRVKMIMDSYENLKVTAPEDLVIAGAILSGRKNRE